MFCRKLIDDTSDELNEWCHDLQQLPKPVVTYISGEYMPSK